MTAQASTRYDGHRSLLAAATFERLSHHARLEARRYQLAAGTSAADRVEALAALGWAVLADRRWSGSRRTRVDFLVVGPGGVLVLGLAGWREVRLMDDELVADGELRDGDVAGLLGMLDRVQDCLGEAGIAPAALRAGVVLPDPTAASLPPHGATVRGVHLLGAQDVAAWATRLGSRLDHDQVERVTGLLEAGFPAAPAGGRAALGGAAHAGRDHPGDPDADEPDPDVLDPGGPECSDPGVGLDDLTAAILDRALAGQLEPWMSVLHPEQLPAVTTSWDGPSLVRGSVGTGKTVVGLHRAAYLATRAGRRVLLVGRGRALPAVLAARCEQMAPEASAAIDFTALHPLAVALLETAGVAVRVDPARARQAFDEACREIGPENLPGDPDPGALCWREVAHVVKGRGLTDLDAYLALPGTGCGSVLSAAEREVVWALGQAYRARLAVLGLHDEADVLLAARDLVRGGTVEHGYDAVVVDEVEDLDLVGLQLLHALVGDAPDGLHLLGDGRVGLRQGGFTLAEAGIDLGGRVTVLRHNHRNTGEILATAVAALPAEAPSADPEITADLPDARRADRHGPPPTVVQAPDRTALETALTRQVGHTVAHGVPAGDLAVLVATAAEVEHYAGVLGRAGIAWTDLRDHDGSPSDLVNIGTFEQAKGLEFRHVLIPGLPGAPAGPPRSGRALFVGMTRARDGLWLGHLG